MTSILYSTNPLEWRLTDAVVIDEQDQPSAPKLSAAPRVAHIMGEFPWGPVHKLTRIKSGDQLVKTFFGQVSDPENYGGCRALMGKQWGPMEIVRVAHRNDQFAGVTLENSSSQHIITLRAKYPGKAGNQIQARIGNVSGMEYTLELKWGSIKEAHSLTFEPGKQPDIDSQLVVVSSAGTPSNLTQANEDWHTLQGGTSQALEELDWTGSETENRGLRVARKGSDGGVWFAAEHNGDAWVASLREVVRNKRAVGLVQAKGNTLEDQVKDAAKVADERIFYFGPLVKQFINGKLTEVHVAPFAASILVKTSPNLSIAEDRWNAYLSAIQSVAHDQELEREIWIQANQAGLNLLEERDTGGYRFHMGITSNPESGKDRIVRRRMTDFVNQNVAAALAPWRNKAQLDVHRKGAVLAIKQRLEMMLGTDASPDSQLIAEYSVVESRVDPTSIEYAVAVRLHGENRFLIAHVMVGENVIINDSEG